MDLLTELLAQSTVRDIFLASTAKRFPTAIVLGVFKLRAALYEGVFAVVKARAEAGVLPTSRIRLVIVGLASDGVF